MANSEKKQIGQVILDETVLDFFVSLYASVSNASSELLTETVLVYVVS